jgi:peptide/nickel transport system ATP-binding protein
MSALLEVSHLKVEFPGRRGTLLALDDISFSIAPGEILGVVGESGAGKSLTGAAIIGLLDPPGRMPRRGLAGRAPHRPVGAARDAARARQGDRRGIPGSADEPQSAAASVEQLIETIQTHLPVGQREATERALLMRAVGIPAPEARFTAYPHRFSGGMRQRMTIARRCAPTGLVVADEPTTALDVSIQAQVLQLLRQLCREQQTAMLLVTHDMGVIAETADRVAVMYAGRIVEIGAVEDVIRSPVHPYTRGLMGAIPTLDESAGRSPRSTARCRGSMPARRAARHPRCPDADRPVSRGGTRLALHGRGMSSLLGWTPRSSNGERRPARRCVGRRPGARQPHGERSRAISRSGDGFLRALGGAGRRSELWTTSAFTSVAARPSALSASRGCGKSTLARDRRTRQRRPRARSDSPMPHR